MSIEEILADLNSKIEKTNLKIKNENEKLRELYCRRCEIDDIIKLKAKVADGQISSGLLDELIQKNTIEKIEKTEIKTPKKENLTKLLKAILKITGVKQTKKKQTTDEEIDTFLNFYLTAAD